MKNNLEKAKDLFQKHNGVLRTSEAVALGIHPRDLYHLRNTGSLESLERGVYRLTSEPNFSDPDLVVVGKKIPQGVLCLISALAHYELTTQIPHYVYIALPRRARIPRLAHPPLRCFHYSNASYEAGIEIVSINAIPTKIYSVEKTLADCVKFRYKIGMDVVLEALKEYWRKGRTDLDLLFEYAAICRVEKILQPIMQTIVSQ